MDSTSEKKPEIVAQDFVQAFQDMNTDKLWALCDPDIIMYIVALWQVDAKPAQSHGFWRSIHKI